jgi:hypothetical protein
MCEEREGDDDARCGWQEKRYVESRFPTEEWYNQNIYPKRMTNDLVATAPVCGRMQTYISTLFRALRSWPSFCYRHSYGGSGLVGTSTYACRNSTVVHTKPPQISTPFAPGIYLCEGNDCNDCLCAFAEVLVVFPGMKTARWALLAPGCSSGMPATTLNIGHPYCKRFLERGIPHANGCLSVLTIIPFMTQRCWKTMGYW